MYTRISPSKNGKASIEYALGLNGKGHNGHDFRNLMVGSVNMIDGDVMSYSDQMAMYWYKASDQHEVQIRRIIVSLSDKEGSPDDPNAVLKLMSACQEFAQESYPNRQALICIQCDGKGKKLHAHMLVNDCDMISSKGCSLEQQKYWFVERHFDKIAERYFDELDSGEKTTKKRETQFQRASEKPSWKDDLYDRVSEVMKVAVSWQDFNERLEDKKVVAVFHENTKGGDDYITYELLDCDKYRDKNGNLPGKKEWLRSKHHKLFKNTEYEKLESLEDVFEENRNKIVDQYGTVTVIDFDEIEEFDDDDNYENDDDNSDVIPHYNNLFDYFNARAEQFLLNEIDSFDEEPSKVNADPLEENIESIPENIQDDLPTIEPQNEMSDEKKNRIAINNEYVQKILAEGRRLAAELEANDIKNKINEMLNEDKK